MKRSIAWLVFALPALSLAVGVLIYYLASTNPDQSIEVGEAPLSKTSWREPQ